MKLVSIGIVTYNNKDVIDEVLQSIKNSTCFENIETFVLDNNSHDNTVDIIKSNYPWVRIIENEYNCGFGAGHNIIINQIQSYYHLVLNPDVRFNSDTISKCVEYMQSHSDIVLLSPKVLNSNGSVQYLPKRHPSIKYVFGGFCDKYFNWARNIRDEYTMRNQLTNEPVEIEFATGCFMFIRTSNLQEVGGFDERYFLHFEDADLSRELEKKGKVVYYPQVCITHNWSRDNRKLSKSLFKAIESMGKYLYKWR